MTAMGARSALTLIGNEKFPFQAVKTGDVVNRYNATSFLAHWVHLDKREWLMDRKSK